LTDDADVPEPWVLYLVECAGARLYAGITNDLPARFAAHCAGRGARFTKAFAPLRVVAATALPSRSEALKAEYALKQRPRAAKLAFLAACGTPIDASALPDARGGAGA
jgi:putative endonuclease